jgi:hypothetical protein
MTANVPSRQSLLYLRIGTWATFVGFSSICLIGLTAEKTIAQRTMPAFWALQLLWLASVLLAWQPTHKRRWLLVGAFALGCLVIAHSIGEIILRAWELGRWF